MIGFTLTMPNVGSWNGRWSGEREIYFISRKLGKKKETELDDNYYRYDFGDGWSAGISCKIIDSKERTKLKRKSSGFCGYDWMVESIIKNGKILIESECK